LLLILLERGKNARVVIPTLYFLEFNGIFINARMHHLLGSLNQQLGKDGWVESLVRNPTPENRSGERREGLKRV